MLTLTEYQNRARTTASQYPNAGPLGGLLYTALGLAGEAGETVDQTKRILRDDNCILTPARRENLKKELGDTLWYVANMAWELGFTLEEVARHNLDKLQDRKKRGVLHGDGSGR